MKKKILIFLLLSMMFPLIVDAKTKTYNICKSGCEYDSILKVWYEINTLQEKADIIVNFKDDSKYTFLDWNYMDIMFEEEAISHIVNQNVQSITINGDKENNTTIDVINLHNEDLRELIARMPVYNYDFDEYISISEEILLLKNGNGRRPSVSEIEEEKQLILDGEEPIIEAFIILWESGTEDLERFLEDYPYKDQLTPIVEDWIKSFKNIFARDLEKMLDDTEKLVTRFMFTGITNTNFEINNINYIGSPYFASSNEKMIGTMNYCNVPNLLLVGGNVELYVNNSNLNRIYAIGTSKLDHDNTSPSNTCDGENYCGDAKIYLNNSDSFLDIVRRFDEETITAWGHELYKNEVMNKLELSALENMLTEKINRYEMDVERVNELLNSEEEKDFDQLITVYDNKTYYCSGYVCYCKEENNYYTLTMEYTPETVNQSIYLADSTEKFLANSIMGEFGGGLIYYNAEKTIDLDISNERNINELFAKLISDNNNIEWKIDNPDIIKIEGNKIIALKRGTATITGINGRDNFKLVVNVKDIQNPFTGASRVIILLVLLVVTLGTTFANKKIKNN